MKKLQHFLVFKFNTKRLKKSKYNLNIKIDEAIQNSELVAIGDSQLLTSLRQIKGLKFDQEYLKSLESKKRTLTKEKDNSDICQKINRIEEEILNIIFVPEIISIVIDDLRHYENIINNGLKINGKNYKRFIVGSGNARRNTVIMIDEKYEIPLRNILNNGRNLEKPMTPAKFSAYFGLYNSSGLKISTPRFAVIKDCVIPRLTKVDFVVEVPDEGNYIEEREMELQQNLFDGMGLISPDFAEYWSNELKLNYVAGNYIVRAPFIKGLLTTFDFKEYAKKEGKYLFEDVWGNQVDIRDVDVILSQSQFKLWDSYLSAEEYKSKCSYNNLGWWITRVSPEEDKHTVYTNYQFLQILDLDNDQIEKLCNPTINYFNDIINSDVNKALIYLLGEMKFEDNWFSSIQDNFTKAMILCKDAFDDDYARNRLRHSLNRKIKDSYLGNLQVKGNFSFIVADPYAFCQHIFDQKVTGLLKDGEGYSNFWNNENCDKIVSMRAPLTHFSEPVLLSLQKNEDMYYWYKHINSGIIFNVFGVEMERMAD